MAIVQASMTEEILSRSEKAVIRGIYRASQLAEAKVTLEKTVLALNPLGSSQKLETSGALQEQLVLLDAYLAHAIRTALVSTKVPSISLLVKDSSPSQA